MYVLIDTIEKVKRFCEIVSTHPGKVYVMRDVYVVDAKSLMGLFSLDLTKPCDVKCDIDVESLYEKIKEFEVPS